MLKHTTFLATLATVLLFGFISATALAQDGRLVTLVLPDGSTAPFTVDVDSRGVLQAGYYSHIGGGIHGSSVGSMGEARLNVGGTNTRIAIDQVVRADLVAPGTATVWRFTLVDGRSFDGFAASSRAQFIISGTNQFGTAERLASWPRGPDVASIPPYNQTFIGIVFDPDAATPGEAATAPAARADVDTVTLRNGDVLSGTILTGEFTVQASYGTLTFTQEQLARINIEDAAGRTDQFVLKVGDRVSGVLQNPTVEMTLTTGATITLEKGNIASITFSTER